MENDLILVNVLFFLGKVKSFSWVTIYKWLYNCLSNKNTKLTDASFKERIISFDVLNCALLSLKKKKKRKNRIYLKEQN